MWLVYHHNFADMYSFQDFSVASLYRYCLFWGKFNVGNRGTITCDPICNGGYGFPLSCCCVLEPSNNPALKLSTRKMKLQCNNRCYKHNRKVC